MFAWLMPQNSLQLPLNALAPSDESGVNQR